MKKSTSDPYENGTFIEMVDTALRRAIAEVIEEHRRSGQPLAVVENGKVAWISPEQVEDSRFTGAACTAIDFKQNQSVENRNAKAERRKHS